MTPWENCTTPYSICLLSEREFYIFIQSPSLLHPSQCLSREGFLTYGNGKSSRWNQEISRKKRGHLMWILLGAGLGGGMACRRAFRRCRPPRLRLRLYMVQYKTSSASSLWEITSVYPPIRHNHLDSLEASSVL